MQWPQRCKGYRFDEVEPAQAWPVSCDLPNAEERSTSNRIIFIIHRLRKMRSSAATWWAARDRVFYPIVFAETAPLDLRIVGRLLYRAALVGVGAGLVGALFFGLLEWVWRIFLEDMAGYVPLRAHGEFVMADPAEPTSFRPWLLVFLPALGGLACGLITRFAPEARGGGSDVMIDAFHHRAGTLRPRLIWVKALASIFTLGTGGAGGREGPTMLIGGAIGSAVARILRVSSRERRILMVAGVAAGVAAVFRTPLGAALLAVEVLYRDGFESEALIPAVLGSVVAYSVVISIYGESTLFAHTARFPFQPSHLPLFLLLAIFIAALGLLFLKVFASVKRWFAGSNLPDWSRPCVGGLILGVLSTPIIMLVGSYVGMPGQGLGVLGGGYGAVQMAITGSPWLPLGWVGVAILLALSVLKLVCASLTVGSGGSAGDFAPSLAIGGLFGGAFGRAAQILFPAAHIDPGAFALVGMGAFYGGIAHVPLSALVLVCELAGNYDLLVPLMLGLAVSFAAVRKKTLYHAQVETMSDSPPRRDALFADVLSAVKVAQLIEMAEAKGEGHIKPSQKVIRFTTTSTAAEMLAAMSEAVDQQVFPVEDSDGKMVGLVTPHVARTLQEKAHVGAAEIMRPPVAITPGDHLRLATERLVANGLGALPVVDAEGRVVGLLDEGDIARACLQAARRAEDSMPMVLP